MANQAPPDLLLGERLAPITSEIGFLEADRRTILGAWMTWLRPKLAARGIGVEAREVRGDLAALLRRLPPLTAGEITRHLLVPTAGPWTGLFNNGLGGSDVTSFVVSLSGELRCRGLRVVAVPNTICEEQAPQRGRYGAVMLYVFGPEVDEVPAVPGTPHAGGFIGRVTRIISVMNDGGPWRFDLEGQVLPFETVERYRVRRIKDRFTIAMLRDYLEALGIRAFDAGFYAPDGVATLIELVGAERNVVRELTLEEAQADF